MEEGDVLTASRIFDRRESVGRDRRIEARGERRKERKNRKGRGNSASIRL